MPLAVDSRRGSHPATKFRRSMENPTTSFNANAARGQNTHYPAGNPLQTGDHPKEEELLAVESITCRVSTANLEQNGIKKVRVLNQSQFLELLERMVEERVIARIEWCEAEGRGWKGRPVRKSAELGETPADPQGTYDQEIPPAAIQENPLPPGLSREEADPEKFPAELISEIKKNPKAVFEIDLDNEFILIKNEPTQPEYNPMAEPLDLTGGLGNRRSGADEFPIEKIGLKKEVSNPDAQGPGPFPREREKALPPGDSRDPLNKFQGQGSCSSSEMEEEILPESIDDVMRLYEDFDLPRSIAIQGIDQLNSNLEASLGNRKSISSSDRKDEPLHGAFASSLLKTVEEESDENQFLEHRLEGILQKCREADRRRKTAESAGWKAKKVAGEGTATLPRKTSPPCTAPNAPRENVPGPQPALPRPSVPVSPSPSTAVGSEREAELKPPQVPSVEETGRFPQFLRGDSERDFIVQAFESILDRRSPGMVVSETELLRLASALASKIRRTPYATFDLGESRKRASVGRETIYTTAMAMCMAHQVQSPPLRLRMLALTGLLSVIVAPSQKTLPEIPADEVAQRVFARRLHKKLLSFGGITCGDSPLRAIKEADVREDLKLLSLVREFWRKIGPGPEGRMEPAAAALALSRGKIAPSAPLRLRQLFLKTFSVFPPGSWVKLSSGEVGIVVAPGSGRVTTPLVLTLFTSEGEEFYPHTPRLVDTGQQSSDQVLAAVQCPLRDCSAPRPVLRVGSAA